MKETGNESYRTWLGKIQKIRLVEFNFQIKSYYLVPLKYF